MSTSTTAYLRIHPRDPIVARDGRPFGDGQANRMRGVTWPYPQMLAGSFRTLLGKLHGAYDPAALLQTQVRGPLPVMEETLYLPAPSDMLLRSKTEAHRLRPDAALRGASDLPAHLSPCLLPPDVLDDFKPKLPPQFLPVHAMVQWLLEDNKFQLEETKLKVATDERTHVMLDAHTLTHVDGKLFTTTGLVFDPRQAAVSLVAAVGLGSANLYAKSLSEFDSSLHPLGGERRLSSWRQDANTAGLWHCPPAIKQALSASQPGARIRLTLASPAIWSGGWAPGWALAPEGAAVPGTNVTLRMVGACVDPWKPISGYSLVKVGDTPRGPKPVRWMVPAGATYFFELLSGKPADLAALWLSPLGDTAQSTQETRDGFGLALWGIWSPHRHHA